MADKNFIKEGRSVVTKRGCLGPGVEVTAKDFTGGQATIDNLLKSDKNPFTNKDPNIEVKKKVANEKKGATEKAIKGASEKVKNCESVLKDAELASKEAHDALSKGKPEEKAALNSAVKSADAIVENAKKELEDAEAELKKAKA